MRVVPKLPVAGLLLALLPSLAQAGPWPSISEPRAVGGGEKDAALVAAAERYVFVPSVAGARRNGVAWYNYFVRGRKIPLDRVALLRDQQVTRERMRAQLRRVAAAVRPGGTLWVVFIGHGAPSKDGKDGLLLGIDTQQTADSLEARSLRRSELLRILGTSKAARRVVLLDTCFSGRTRSGQSLVPGLQPLVVEARKAPPATAPETGGSTLLLAAAAGDEFAGALPGASRPAFSYLALGALRGWADTDGDGRVTADEIYAYAKRALTALVTDRTQTPTLEGPGDTGLGKAWEKGPDLARLVVKLGEPPASKSAPAAAASKPGRPRTEAAREPAAAPRKSAPAPAQPAAAVSKPTPAPAAPSALTERRAVAARFRSSAEPPTRPAASPASSGVPPSTARAAPARVPPLPETTPPAPTRPAVAETTVAGAHPKARPPASIAETVGNDRPATPHEAGPRERLVSPPRRPAPSPAEDRTRLVRVLAPSAGQVSRVFVVGTGAWVRRGQPLASVANPTLLQALRQYADMVQGTSGMPASGLGLFRTIMLRNARARLRSMGVGEAVLQRIDRGGEPNAAAAVRAPVAGRVVRNHALVGTYVSPGSELFALAPGAAPNGDDGATSTGATTGGATTKPPADEDEPVAAPTRVRTSPTPRRRRARKRRTRRRKRTRRSRRSRRSAGIRLAGTWTARFSTSSYPSGRAKFQLRRSGSTVAGRYTTSLGGFGVVVGQVRGRNLVLALRSTSADCPGAYRLVGSVRGRRFRFQLTGLDCSGAQAGRGVATRR